MQLEFISVEEFYFALTLAVKTLGEIEQPDLVGYVRAALKNHLGTPSTVAPGEQNTFNYVFRVHDYPRSDDRPLIVSISDWRDKLRLASDFGWTLDGNRKPVHTPDFSLRPQFTRDLKIHLQDWLAVQFP
jgi:hypothetical protein